MKNEKPVNIIITLPVPHNLAVKPTKAEELEIRATHCAYMAEGLFRLIAKACQDSAFQTDEEETQVDFALLTALGYTAEIGVALLNSCTEYIDQMVLCNQQVMTAKQGK